jgi:acyl-CoA thioesterase
VAPGRWAFELTNGLSRFDGKLYGGTGIAVATRLIEAATDRAALWATAQFAASADIGDRIECHVEVLAQGHRTSQVRITAGIGDQIVFTALGASGDARTGGLDAQIATVPDVAPPDGLEPWSPRVPFTLPETNRGWLDLIDVREVPGPESTMALWARMREGHHSRSTLGFVADMVPSAVVRAAGRAGGGRSLDNAIRFGPEPDTEWVLIDLDPYFAAGGYVHGAARLWSQDGVQLAVASQTAVAIVFD